MRSKRCAMQNQGITLRSERHLDELHTSPHALGIVPLKINTDKVLSYSFASIENLLLNFTRALYKEFVITAKKFGFVF